MRERQRGRGRQRERRRETASSVFQTKPSSLCSDWPALTFEPHGPPEHSAPSWGWGWILTFDLHPWEAGQVRDPSSWHWSLAGETPPIPRKTRRQLPQLVLPPPVQDWGCGYCSQTLLLLLLSPSLLLLLLLSPPLLRCCSCCTPASCEGAWPSGGGERGVAWPRGPASFPGTLEWDSGFSWWSKVKGHRSVINAVLMKEN